MYPVTLLYRRPIVFYLFCWFAFINVTYCLSFRYNARTFQDKVKHIRIDVDILTERLNQMERKVPFQRLTDYDSKREVRFPYLFACVCVCVCVSWVYGSDTGKRLIRGQPWCKDSQMQSVSLSGGRALRTYIILRGSFYARYKLSFINSFIYSKKPH